MGSIAGAAFCSALHRSPTSNEVSQYTGSGDFRAARGGYAANPTITLHLDSELAIHQVGILPITATLREPRGDEVWRCVGWSGDGSVVASGQAIHQPVCPARSWFKGPGAYRFSLAQEPTEPAWVANGSWEVQVGVDVAALEVSAGLGSSFSGTRIVAPRSGWTFVAHPVLRAPGYVASIGWKGTDDILGLLNRSPIPIFPCGRVRVLEPSTGVLLAVAGERFGAKPNPFETTPIAPGAFRAIPLHYVAYTETDSYKESSVALPAGPKELVARFAFVPDGGEKFLYQVEAEVPSLADLR